MAFKIMEMEVKEKLDEATKTLHSDTYNCEVQGLVNNLRDKMRRINKQNAKGVAVRSRVVWKKVGDKCSRKFFRVV